MWSETVAKMQEGKLAVSAATIEEGSTVCSLLSEMSAVVTFRVHQQFQKEGSSELHDEHITYTLSLEEIGGETLITHVERSCKLGRSTFSSAAGWSTLPQDTSDPAGHELVASFYQKLAANDAQGLAGLLDPAGATTVNSWGELGTDMLQSLGAGTHYSHAELLEVLYERHMVGSRSLILTAKGSEHFTSGGREHQSVSVVSFFLVRGPTGSEGEWRIRRIVRSKGHGGLSLLQMQIGFQNLQIRKHSGAI